MNNVDSSGQPFSVLEWCAGYGGIGMGLKRVIGNMRTVAYAEIELYCCEILAARMAGGQIDTAPIWSNIKTFPCEQFKGLVDCLVAGYPCQPFSHAGQRQGSEDEKGRHLWPHVQRAIAIIRPKFCFFENVSGHLTLGLKDVLHDLSELDFEVTCGLFTARAEGLPHKRQRLFILAHDKSAGAGLDERRLRRQPCEADGEGHGVGQADSDCGGGVEDSQLTELRADGIKQSSDHSGGTESPEGSQEREGEILADSEKQRIQRRRAGGEQVARPHAGEALSLRDGDPIGIDLAPSGPGSEQYWWEPARVLGNAPSERPRGGREDGAGEQSEVPRQGLGDAGAGVGLADPARDSEQGRRPRQGQKQFGRSGTAQHRHEIIQPLGGGTNGLAGGLAESDLLAAYQSLRSSCHSRTDELRAAGNGVIPACAATAWVTLYNELMT